MKLTLETAKQGKTCSLKLDGHIKESRGQISFLANSACVGLTFPGCSPQYEINEFPVTWLIVLLEVWTRSRGSCTSQHTWRHTTSRNVYTNPRRGDDASILLRVSNDRRCYRQEQLLAGRGLCWQHRSWHGSQMVDRPLRATPPEKRQCQIYRPYNLSKTKHTPFILIVHNTSTHFERCGLFWWHHTVIFSCIISP